MNKNSSILSIFLLIIFFRQKDILQQLMDKNDFTMILHKIETGEINVTQEIKNRFQTKKLEIMSVLERITNTLSSKRDK